jgi:hypothetical protein
VLIIPCRLSNGRGCKKKYDHAFALLYVSKDISESGKLVAAIP